MSFPAQAAKHSNICLRQSIRHQALQRRQALSAPQKELLDARLGEQLVQLLQQIKPNVVGFYWPIRNEPDLRPCLSRWLGEKHTRQAALPVVCARDAPLQFHRWQADSPMTQDQQGIPIPLKGEALQPQLLLIPLVAFNAQGYRIGYGGGYYDRTLPTISALAVGVGYELARVAHIPVLAHDQPMQWLVTENAIFNPGQKSATLTPATSLTPGTCDKPD